MKIAESLWRGAGSGITLIVALLVVCAFWPDCRIARRVRAVFREPPRPQTVYVEVARPATGDAMVQMAEEARRLAAFSRGGSQADLSRPLASRGLVSQVTPASVVYDAETTRGGSGGPVLSLGGEVIAVTHGVLEGFGGSNLGVPAGEVRDLIAVSWQAADSAAAALRGSTQD